MCGGNNSKAWTAVRSLAAMRSAIRPHSMFQWVDCNMGRTAALISIVKRRAWPPKLSPDMIRPQSIVLERLVNRGSAHHAAGPSPMV